MTTTNLRTYSNRFASMEEQPGGGWVIGDREYYLDYAAGAAHRPQLQTRGGRQQLVVRLTNATLNKAAALALSIAVAAALFVLICAPSWRWAENGLAGKSSERRGSIAPPRQIAKKRGGFHIRETRLSITSPA